MSVDPKFIELTPDVLRHYILKITGFSISVVDPILPRVSFCRPKNELIFCFRYAITIIRDGLRVVDPILPVWFCSPKIHLPFEFGCGIIRDGLVLYQAYLFHDNGHLIIQVALQEQRQQRDNVQVTFDHANNFSHNMTHSQYTEHRQQQLSLRTKLYTNRNNGSSTIQQKKRPICDLCALHRYQQGSNRITRSTSTVVLPIA